MLRKAASTGKEGYLIFEFGISKYPLQAYDVQVTASLNVFASFNSFSAAFSISAKLRWFESNSGSVDSRGSKEFTRKAVSHTCHYRTTRVADALFASPTLLVNMWGVLSRNQCQ